MKLEQAILLIRLFCFSQHTTTNTFNHITNILLDSLGRGIIEQQNKKLYKPNELLLFIQMYARSICWSSSFLIGND